MASPFEIYKILGNVVPGLKVGAKTGGKVAVNLTKGTVKAGGKIVGLGLTAGAGYLGGLLGGSSTDENTKDSQNRENASSGQNGNIRRSSNDMRTSSAGATRQIYNTPGRSTSQNYPISESILPYRLSFPQISNITNLFNSQEQTTTQNIDSSGDVIKQILKRLMIIETEINSLKKDNSTIKSGITKGLIQVDRNISAKLILLQNSLNAQILSQYNLLKNSFSNQLSDIKEDLQATKNSFEEFIDKWLLDQKENELEKGKEEKQSPSKLTEMIKGGLLSSLISLLPFLAPILTNLFVNQFENVKTFFSDFITKELPKIMLAAIAGALGLGSLGAAKLAGKGIAGISGAAGQQPKPVKLTSQQITQVTTPESLESSGFNKRKQEELKRLKSMEEAANKPGKEGTKAKKAFGSQQRAKLKNLEKQYNEVTKKIIETAEKELAEEAAKGALKTGVLKSLAKKLPFISILAGLGFGAYRAMEGDYEGAALEVLSGVLGTVGFGTFGLGTMGSLAIDASLIARDMGAFEGTRFGKPQKSGETDEQSSDSQSSIEAKDLPDEAKQLLNDIAKHEGANYNTIVGEGKQGAPATFSDYSKHPNIKGFFYADGDWSTAAGRYGITKTSWDEYTKKYPDLIDFSPENQDKAAWYMASERYRAKTGRNLIEDLKNGKYNKGQILSQLSGTWSSLPGGKQPATNRPGGWSYDYNNAYTPSSKPNMTPSAPPAVSQGYPGVALSAPPKNIPTLNNNSMPDYNNMPDLSGVFKNNQTARNIIADPVAPRYAEDNHAVYFGTSLPNVSSPSLYG